VLIRPFFYSGRAIRATSVASSYPSRGKKESIEERRKSIEKEHRRKKNEGKNRLKK